MATITDRNKPWRYMEVDASFQAGQVTIFPRWEWPRAFAFSANPTLLSHTTANTAFAFRNSDPQVALLVRYLSVVLEDGAAASPVAAIEYGMDLFVARRWISRRAVGVAAGTIPEPLPLRVENMPRSVLTQQSSATMDAWDIRIPANSTGTSVVHVDEQFELDTQPFASTRGWHLIAGATVPKTRQLLEYDQRDPGLYPLTLAPNEGIILKPGVSTWANINLSINMEWEEVPLAELDRGPWQGGRT